MLGCASLCSAPPWLLLTLVLGSSLPGSITLVPSTPSRRWRPRKGSWSHMPRKASLTLGITSSPGFALCWQNADAVGAVPSQPKASFSSTGMVSPPHVTIRRTRSGSGSFLLLVKSLAGSLAHASGTEHTSPIASSSLASASACAVFVAIAYPLASEVGRRPRGGAPFFGARSAQTRSGRCRATNPANGSKTPAGGNARGLLDGLYI